MFMNIYQNSHMKTFNGIVTKTTRFRSRFIVNGHFVAVNGDKNNYMYR